jgi:hypothetical protein
VDTDNSLLSGILYLVIYFFIGLCSAAVYLAFLTGYSREWLITQSLARNEAKLMTKIIVFFWPLAITIFVAASIPEIIAVVLMYIVLVWRRQDPRKRGSK